MRRKRFRFRRIIVILILLFLTIKIKNKFIDINNVFMNTRDKEININEEDINSKSAYLVEKDTGKVILDKNAHTIIYPASMTKIMTGILAIENISDLNEYIIMSDDIINFMTSEGASTTGIIGGEEVKVIDLIYGNLLPSGGDASIALARRVAGSEEEFVELMNSKARELGMDSTNFTNSSGLHNENQYSTVKDIYKLLNYSLKNEIFNNIIRTDRYYMEPTNFHPEGMTLESTLFKDLGHLENSSLIKGGKTGFTSKAGLCLASIGEKNGIEYILVTANGDVDEVNTPYNILDALFIYSNIE